VVTEDMEKMNNLQVVAISGLDVNNANTVIMKIIFIIQDAEIAELRIFK
jgi:hypothetical protein